MTHPDRTLRALVICHEDVVGAGFVEERLIERGLEVTRHTVVPDIERPDLPSSFPELDGYDVVIPMGSYFSVYDRATIGAWIDEEIELLANAHRQGVPVLGICFGGQALAAALGGNVEAAERTELGWYEIEPLVADLPVAVGPWLEWHHDRFSVPPGAQLLARTETAPQLFRSGTSVGTQFHPEISVELMQAWLEQAEDEYLATYQVTREQLLRDVQDHEMSNRANCYDLVDWFLADVAGLMPRREGDEAAGREGHP